MSIQPFLGWAPDADATTPGILVDVEMMEPSQRGMKAAPAAVATDLPALASACLGAALVTKLDGTKRLFAGTATGLFEAGSGAWTDRSAAAYATGDGRWRFAQFGDVSIAVNGADDPQTMARGAMARGAMARGEMARGAMASEAIARGSMARCAGARSRLARTWRDGAWLDGARRDGTWLDGAWLDGAWRDGPWREGAWCDGAQVHGATARMRNGVLRIGMSRNGE